MFAYCANNPANCSDQSGCRPIWERRYGNGVVGYTDTGTGVCFYELGNGTSLRICGSSAIITAHLYFEEPLVLDKKMLIDGIKKYWDGYYQLGSRSFLLTVKLIEESTCGANTIRVFTKDGNDTSFACPYWYAYDAGPKNSLTIYSHYLDGSEKDIGYSMAHEMVHMLGVDDYSDGYSASGPSIMDTPGLPVIPAVLEKVFTAFRTDTYQLWP